MTIEVALSHGDQKTTLGHIAPGEIITMSDYGHESGRGLLLAHCLPNDSGGEIYSLSNPGYAENKAVRLISALDLLGVTPEAVINTNGTYSRQITTEARRVANVLFTHISPA